MWSLLSFSSALNSLGSVQAESDLHLARRLQKVIEPGLEKDLGCLFSCSQTLDSKPRAIPLAATGWQACLLPWLEDSIESSQLSRGRMVTSLWGTLYPRQRRNLFWVTQQVKLGPSWNPGLLSPRPRPLLLPSSSPAILPSHPCGHLPKNLEKGIQNIRDLFCEVSLSPRHRHSQCQQFPR